MRRSRQIVRIAAPTAVAVAALAIAFILTTGGSSYEVTARFVNAGQLVRGNVVQAGGVPIGSVERIVISDDGRADITFSLEDTHAPLPAGTRATVRQLSLSGVANRYVDLTFPPDSGAGTIADGGRIEAAQTSTQVDLDEVVNALDADTREALDRGLKLTGRAIDGEQFGAMLEYLDPGLQASTRWLSEINRERPALEGLVRDGAELVTALAQRRDDVANLVDGIERISASLASQSGALGDSIEQLPPVLRRANTTFINLRAALGDLDPLIAAARPSAKDVAPLLASTRALAADAKPAIDDLLGALRRAGAGNDVIDLVRALPALEEIAVQTKSRSLSPGGHEVDVGSTRGALPQTADALRDVTPVISYARPYTSDFLGWLDDFSSTGGFTDATTGITRTFISLAENMHGAPPLTGQFRRCPGAGDVVLPDRSNVLSAAEQQRLDCTEEHRAVK